MSKYMTLRDLQKMAVGKKIKYYMKLSKTELIKALNLDEKIVCKPSNAKEVLITNVETQVVTRCKSIYQCSKMLKKNNGSIQYYIKCGNEFMDVNGNKVKLSFA